MEQESTVQRPRRREYSGEFKGAVLEQCRRQGASVAGVALGHGLNPNMVHRWIREERQQKLLVSLNGGGAFVPLQIQPSPAPALPAVEAGGCEAASPATTAAEVSIRIEIQRPQGCVTVHWPVSAAQQCAQLLGVWLR